MSTWVTLTLGLKDGFKQRPLLLALLVQYVNVNVDYLEPASSLLNTFLPILSGVIIGHSNLHFLCLLLLACHCVCQLQYL